MTSESFLFSIGTSIFWITLTRLVGLCKHIFIASVIGLSTQLDIFYMIMGILGLLIFSWGSLMEIVSIPRMVKLHNQKRITEFTALTTGLFSLTLLFSLVLTLLVYLFWDYIKLIAIGFDEHQRELLQNALFWLIPACLLYIPYRFISSISRSLRNFSTIYQSEFLIGLVVSVVVIIFHDNPTVLLWSFSIGISCAFIYLFISQHKLIVKFNNPFSEEVLSCLKYAPSLLLLSCIDSIFILSDRIFLSYLAEGAISALAYGLILISFIPNLFGLSNSFITILSEKTKIEIRSQLINDIFSMCIYLSIGIGLFMILYRDLWIELILQRGLFDADDTIKVSTAILGYSGLILTIILFPVIFSVYQLEKKISLMAIHGSIGAFVNIILNIFFLFILNWGLVGIALATSISSILVMTIGLYGLSGLGYQVAWSRHLKWLLWMVLPISVIFWLDYIIPIGNFNVLVQLSVGSVLILSIMLIAGYIHRGKEGLLVRSSLAKIYTGIKIRLTKTA